MNSGALLLSYDLFKILLDKLLRKFEEEHKVAVAPMRRFQLFGYGTFNAQEPNLKSFIHQKTGYWVNGKYLYMKLKEYEDGQKLIKLTREFVFVYFRALGYKDILDFLSNAEGIPQELKKEQLELLGDAIQEDHEEYYVGYYLGEEHSFIKTTLTIFNNWKEVHWKLVYWEGEDEVNLFEYRGTVSLNKNRLTLHFSDMRSHHIERYAQICLFWSETLQSRPYLLGVYTGFDWNDCPVAGEIIFERVASEQEQQVLVTDKAINPVIADRLLGKRITTESIIRQSPLDFTPNSRYISLLDRFIGDYSGCIFTFDCNFLSVELEIRPTNQRSAIKVGNFWTLNGFFQVKHNAQFLTCRFIEEGYDREIDLLIYTNSLHPEYLHGVISGVDTSNQAFQGKFILSNQNAVLQITEDVITAHITGLSTEANGLPPTIILHLNEWLQGFKTLIGQSEDFNQEKHNEKNYQDTCHRLAGMYTLYHKSATSTIHKDVIRLDTRGIVEFESCDALLKGVCTKLQNGILLISIGEVEESHRFIHIAAFVGSNTRDDIEYLPVILSLNDKFFRPISVQAFLFKSGVHDSDLLPEKFDIDETGTLSDLPSEVLSKLKDDKAEIVVTT